jgi:hypothetical protein
MPARFAEFRRLSQLGVLATPGRWLLFDRLPGVKATRLAPVFCGNDGRNADVSAGRAVLKL